MLLIKRTGKARDRERFLRLFKSIMPSPMTKIGTRRELPVSLPKTLVNQLIDTSKTRRMSIEVCIPTLLDLALPPLHSGNLNVFGECSAARYHMKDIFLLSSQKMTITRYPRLLGLFHFPMSVLASRREYNPSQTSSSSTLPSSSPFLCLIFLVHIRSLFHFLFISFLLVACFFFRFFLSCTLSKATIPFTFDTLQYPLFIPFFFAWFM